MEAPESIKGPTAELFNRLRPAIAGMVDTYALTFDVGSKVATLQTATGPAPFVLDGDVERAMDAFVAAAINDVLLEDPNFRKALDASLATEGGSLAEVPRAIQIASIRDLIDRGELKIEVVIDPVGPIATMQWIPKNGEVMDLVTARVQ